MKKTTISALVLAGALAATPVVAQQKFITIGTGGVTGVYYSAGGAICRLVNKGRADHGIRCAVESTAASFYNINTLRAGELDFGIAQSDAQYNAYHGFAHFKDQGAFSELRSVFALYPEPLTIVARKDAGIAAFTDFKGKRFSAGNPDSGTRSAIDHLLGALGMNIGDFLLIAELKPDEHGSALCDGRIDAFSFVVGHPAANIQDAAAACGARLVSIPDTAIDKLVSDHPYYAAAIIPGGMYTNNPNDTHTFGVVASLVASSRVPDDVVYTLVKSVFDNFEDFKKLHPALAELDPRHMVRDGLSAPLHNGAIRYYKQRGWLK
ncbi:MAG: TAXI family TRAP transporter solute-binding subunit [Azoarcus sp.]|jgi:TRAP transporter TAXI family solute receptor|nr:TAXI family TRAP transporter solute-binding subunit [Azoarcus sp.]